MEESIRKCFGLAGQDVRKYSPLTLAYIGDGVYELVIRTVVVIRAISRRSSCTVPAASW